LKTVNLLPSTFANKNIRISSEYQNQDVQYLDDFRVIIREWCVQNDFLIVDKTGDEARLVPNVGPEDKLLVRSILEINFRVLTDTEILNNFIDVLKDTEHDYTSTRIIDLTIYIMTYLDAAFINRYVNKLYHSLDMFRRDNTESWETIHQDYPWLWIIYAIQQELKLCVPKMR